MWWISFGYKNERYVYGRLVVVGLRALWPFYGLMLEVWLGLELGPKWVDKWGIVRTELKIRCFPPWKFWHFVKIVNWLKQRNETLKSKTIRLSHWGWNWWRCCCCCCCFCFLVISACMCGLGTSLRQGNMPNLLWSGPQSRTQKGIFGP